MRQSPLLDDDGLPRDEENSEPESVQDFMASMGHGENQVTVSLHRVGGDGEKGQIRTYKGADAAEYDVDAIGRECGPGKYQWKFSWYDPSTKKKVNRSWTATLTADHYADEHAAFQRQKRERQLAALPTANPIVQAPAQDAEKLLEKQIDGSLRLLEMMKPVRGEGSGEDKTMAFMTILMDSQRQASAQMAQLQMQQSQMAMQAQQSQMALMGTIITAMMGKPQGTDPMGMFTMVMDAAHKITDVKQALLPAEKETVVERLTTLVADNLPAVLNLASMRAEERAKSLTYQMVKGNPDVKMVESDPALKAEMVDAVIERTGLRNGRKMAAAMGWDEFLPEIDEAIKAREAPKVIAAPAASQAPEQAPVVEGEIGG